MQNPPVAGNPQRIEVILHQPASTTGGPDWLGAATALVWPLVTLLIVIVLRESIASALKGLGARAKSFSVGILAFDFGEVAVKGQITPESLDDIRDTASHIPVGEGRADLDKMPTSFGEQGRVTAGVPAPLLRHA